MLEVCAHLPSAAHCAHLPNMQTSHARTRYSPPAPPLRRSSAACASESMVKNSARQRRFDSDAATVIAAPGAAGSDGGGEGDGEGDGDGEGAGTCSLRWGMKASEEEWDRGSVAFAAATRTRSPSLPGTVAGTCGASTYLEGPACELSSCNEQRKHV